MLHPWKLRIAWPKRSGGKRAAAEQTERQPREAAIEPAVSDLAHRYLRSGAAAACGHVAQLIASAADPDQHAACYLSLGQLMEQARNYAAAFCLYTEALLLEPVDQRTRYLLHNKAGLCLNQFGRYVEAERLCRRAIAMAPERHNAYKNLGVSLQGQGRFAEAAHCFITAVLTNAADARALRHLEDLFDRHPPRAQEVPDFEHDLESCRLAVQTTSQWRQRLPRRDSSSQ